MANKKPSIKNAVPTLFLVIALTAATFCLPTAAQNSANTSISFAVTIDPAGTGATFPTSCQDNKDCVRVAANTTTARINANADCWKIANKTAKDIFIPTKTQAEFNSFKDHIPSTIATVAPCSGGCDPASPTITVGDGTTAKPYLVCNCAQLQAIASNPSSSYSLTQDFSCSETSSWNIAAGNAQGFNPIANFSGTLEGNNHTVDYLFITRPTMDTVGLFKNLLGTGKIQNIKLDILTVIGQNYVGGLAGNTVAGSSITNSHILSGFVSGSADVGSLVGWANGSITSSSAKTSVYASGDYAGGLTGIGGNITQSYAVGSVQANDFAGGLTGFTNGNLIKESLAAVNVTGVNYVGGIAGEHTGTINDSYAIGSVIATGNYAGGLAGWVLGAINRSYATGKITAAGANSAGGLVGETLAGSTVADSFATGKVTGSTVTGGLIGKNAGTITNSYWDQTKSLQANACSNACAGAAPFTASTDAYLKTQLPLSNWDFTTVWDAISCSYPNLRNVNRGQNTASQGCVSAGWYSMSPAGSSDCITFCANKGLHWGNALNGTMCHTSTPSSVYGTLDGDAAGWYCGVASGSPYSGLTDQCYCESQGWSGTGCATCPAGSNYYFFVNEYPVCNPPAACTNGVTYGGPGTDNPGTCNYDPSGRDEQSYWTMKCK